MFDPKLKEALSRVQKPGRYTGGEPGSVYKDKEKVDVRFAFCFPDTYEVGMSFLGEKILYELLNSHENWWCERAFMPWLDMKAEMERLQLPLYTMESKDPLTAFDAVGFTLQYELSYTNILNMLDLGGVPLLAKDRTDADPFVIVGGPCVYNPEPLADFFDFAVIGEGEEVLIEVMRCYKEWKREGKPGGRQEFLQRVVKIILLPCQKCTSRQRKIFLPEALLHLADRVANLTLQVTGKIFEFRELTHQFSLYDPS